MGLVLRNCSVSKSAVDPRNLATVFCHPAQCIVTSVFIKKIDIRFVNNRRFQRILFFQDDRLATGFGDLAEAPSRFPFRQEAKI